MGGTVSSDEDIRHPTDCFTSLTPPWHVSHTQTPESAIRSTLSTPNGPQPSRHDWRQHKRSRPDEPAATSQGETAGVAGTYRGSLHSERARKAEGLLNDPPCFNPINLFPRPEQVKYLASDIGQMRALHHAQRPLKQPTNSTALLLDHARILPGFDVDMHEFDSVEQPVREDETLLMIDQSLEVDRMDGRVWHLNHQRGGSYSGTFANKERAEKVPAQALAFIQEMKERQAKPERMRQSVLLLQEARELLEKGECLILERTSFVEYGESIPCCRSGCPSKDGLAENTHYLSLGLDRTFCLTCFEKLWSGEYTDGNVPGILSGALATPNERKDSATVPTNVQLDGLNHKAAAEIVDDQAHSTGTPQHRPTTPPQTSLDLDEDDLSSPSSTLSDGQWRFPPTRFQRLARSVKPGYTLPEPDEAALTLWKAASASQYRWERHLRRAQRIRDYYAGLTAEDEELRSDERCADEDDDEEEVLVDERDLESTTGLRKKHCHGKQLSYVLRLAAEWREMERAYEAEASSWKRTI